MAGEWLEQLSTDLRDAEALHPYREGSISDFAKAHIETLGKVSDLEGKAKEFEGKATDLEGKLANSIPKLGENPTDEEKAAFFKAIGMPEEHTAYTFPNIEGQENDPQMVEWAQKTFHQAGLTPEQAYMIGGAWNHFVEGLMQAEAEELKATQEKAKEAILKEAGSEEKYNAIVELSSRLFKEATGTEMDDFLGETGIGYDPRFIQVMLYFAKKTGEDKTLQAAPRQQGDVKEGLIYDKSPAPPAQQ